MGFPRPHTAAALGVMTLAPVCAQAQTQQVRIRILNGHTGKPVVHTGVFSRIEPVRRSPEQKMPVTDGNGLVTIEVPSQGRVNAIAGTYPTCRHVAKADRRNGPIMFPVGQIVSTGVVESNNCSKKTVPPTPGELTLFVRPLHWWERLSD
jgi:hypothetical protein